MAKHAESDRCPTAFHRYPLVRFARCSIIRSIMKEEPLPSAIEQYLAPQGGFMIDDKTGIHYTTFSLRRKN